MHESKETALRYIAILQLIPVYPDSITVREIHNKLSKDNLLGDVTPRTIQRILESKLSHTFPITCDTEGRTNKWFWVDKNALTQIPAMGKSQALAFKLASEYLTPILPTETLKLLRPYFNYADDILKETKLGKWSKRTKIISRGQNLIPPTINNKVQEVVYQALLEEKQIEVNYKSRWADEAKRYTLHPLGIVFREGVIYLVATAWDYEEPRHFVLHRMSKPKLLETPSKELKCFDLNKHIEEDNEFSYPISGKKIKLKALFSEEAAIHLFEHKLSEDQETKKQDDGEVLVTATVDNTDELRWWILSFGDQVEILGPASLRNNLSEISEYMADMYN